MLNLPQNGSAVIVDDQPNQALPIITALSKRGIATTWYRGNDPDEIPDSPIQKVRMIFMDLQLVEGDNDAHTISSRVLGILERLIPADNGPFMLIIWSLKDSFYGRELMTRLGKQKGYLRPICTVTLNKRACIRQVQENRATELIEEVQEQLKKAGFEKNDLDSVASAIKDNWIVNKDAEYEVLSDAVGTIETAIGEELLKAGIFQLFIIWENLIKNSAAQTVADISAILDHDEHWEQNMRDVFRRMGIARVGQNKVSDEKLLKESILTFIQSFTDNLEAQIHQMTLPDHLAKKSEQLFKIKADNRELRLVYGASGFQILFNGSPLLSAGDLVKLNKNISSHKNEEEKKIAQTLLHRYNTIPAKLNTGLHLERKPTKVHIPGNIFEIPIKNTSQINEFLKTYFSSVPETRRSEITFIELEISPICDYAQKNWKKSRLISGIIYPADMEIKSKTHFYNVEPIFYLNESFKRVVFDCHLLKALDHEIVEKREIKYRLRRELLLDVIAKVAAHVNRPGISFVA